MKSLRRLLFAAVACAALLLFTVALAFSFLFPQGWQRLRQERQWLHPGSPPRDFGLVLLEPEGTRPMQFLALLLLLSVGGCATLLGRYVDSLLKELREVSDEFARTRQVPQPSFQELLPCSETFEELSRAIRQRETELENQRVLLEEENRVQSALLAGLAEELRHRLPALMDAHQDLSTLQGLLQDLEQAAELHSRQVPLQLERVGVEAAVEDCLRQLEPLLSRVHLERTVQDLSVRADPLRLRQILLNLLGNALKFSPPGGTLSIRSRTRDRMVILEIEDDGPGAPTDVLENAEAGQELRRQFGGTGLGLMISRRLAELQGGTLRLQSRPVGGTLASLELPSEPETGSERFHST